jgi:RNA-directed DNA polymerase
MNAPPLLVSFNSLDKYLEALPEKQQERYGDEIRDLFLSGFPPVVSPFCLSIIFGYSLNFVHALSKKQHKFYRSFEIRQGKKQRNIFSPKVALKVIQKWISFHLSAALTFPPHVCGFIQGKSFVDSAKIHVGAAWVMSVDIKNFFPSISKEQVTGALKVIGYSEAGAELVANLCCLKNCLPQGSPASPVLSNLVMKQIDIKLTDLANFHSLQVSRYADDIVFSGKNDFLEILATEIDDIFLDTGLELNKDKFYLADARKGQRLKVHGLLVKEDNVSLTKGYKNKIRAYKHMLSNGKVKTEDVPRLTGHVTYSTHIDESPKVK